MERQQTYAFRLPFTQISALPARDGLEKIRGANKIPLGELKVFDLILDNDTPTSIWHGVYVYFSEGGRCLYVGKNGAQNFVERIPWHFALHEKAWMNHFLKYLRNSKNLGSLGEAALSARSCALLLIPVEEAELITPLEKFLRIFLEPEFNKYSEKYRARYNKISLSDVLGVILRTSSN